MKLLLVNALYPPVVLGGAERSVQFLAEFLAQSGHEVVVATTVPRRESRVETLRGVRVHYVGLRNIYWPYGPRQPAPVTRMLWHALDIWNPLMAKAFDRILEAERPDLVHTNVIAGFSPAIWRVVKRRGIPLVHTLRDYYLICPKSTMFKAGRNCDRACRLCSIYAAPKRAMADHVDVAVGVSRFVLDRHRRLGFFGKSDSHEVVNNAYERANGRPNEPATGPQALRLGYLGRLHPSKGVERLLEACSRPNGGARELLVAGQGEDGYESDLRRRFAAPNIRFLGFVKPEELFSAIDVLVVPSLWHEPLPRTVFEAYAHGVPVIAAGRGGIPEMVEEERTGLVFEPARPQSLEEAIARLASEPELVERMKANVTVKAGEFLPKRIVGSYADIYQEAADRRRRDR